MGAAAGAWVRVLDVRVLVRVRVRVSMCRDLAALQRPTCKIVQGA